MQLRSWICCSVAALAVGAHAGPQRVIPELYPAGTIAPGKIKVKFRANALNSKSVSPLARPIVPGATLESVTPNSTWTVWRLPEGMVVADAKVAIQRRSDVAYVEPVFKVKILLADPNDPDFAAVENRLDYYLDVDPDTLTFFERCWNLNDINAKAAWSIFPNQYFTSASKPKHPPTVAVIDSGLDIEGNGHPDFINVGGSSIWKTGGGQFDQSRSRRWSQGTFFPTDNGLDENGHGTHVAGIALAVANNGGFNGFGMIGTGYDCQGMNLRIIEDNGSGDDNDAANAIRYAADRGADVINMSFGTQDFSLALQDACTYAFQKGCVLVAAGNESGDPAGLPPSFPSACSGVLGVTASTYTRIPSSLYAGSGNYIDLAAPGGDVLIDDSSNFYFVYVHSTMPRYHCFLNDLQGYFTPIGNDYTSLFGTSMASPHVAGAAGLLLDKWNSARQGGWANVRAMQALERGAAQAGGNWNTVKGWGDLDMEAAALESNARGATKGSIEGIVYLGTPASNAQISAKKVGGTTTIGNNSDSKGFYRFGALDPGVYEVTAKVQFDTKVKLISVKSGCNAPGQDFWIKGNPDDATAPVIGRLELAASPSTTQVQLRHWAYDTETGVDGVKIRIGTTPGGTQKLVDTAFAIDGATLSIGSLALTNGATYWLRATYTNGAGLASSLDLPFTVAATLRTVSGKVTFGDAAATGVYGAKGDVMIRDGGNPGVVATHPVSIDPDGSYSFTTTFTGNAVIGVRADTWLRNKVTRALSTASVTNVNMNLTNGDVDGDNVVSVFDYLILSDSFDTTYGMDFWDMRADLDRDDTVSLFDYLILSENFDVSGAEV